MSEDNITFVSEELLELGPWPAFERTIARMLHHAGFEDVKIVNGPHDKGADVVASKDGELYVVQAKYRSSGNQGKKAIEEALTAKREYGADICITVTNQFFSKDAKEFNDFNFKLGFKTYLWNKKNLLKMAKTMPLKSKNIRPLRDYQKEAINEIFKSLDAESNKGLVTLATGLGKTIIASTFISKFLDENPHCNVLVLAHMTELVRQLAQASWSQLNCETITSVWADGERPKIFHGVVFATWQSILKAIDNDEIKSGFYDLIIVDECHHAPSNSFSKLLKKLNPSYLLGVTATPWRSDKNSLRYLFGEPLFSMSVVEGMQKGFLSKVDYRMLTDGIDWDHISYLSKNGHTVKNLNQNLYVPERDRGMVKEIIDEINTTENPRVLVFCRSIRHAERLLKFFKMYDAKALVLHSELKKPERFKAISSFREGSITVLISIEMLNEGIDVPEVNIVCFARVTHSRRIFLQQLGRGLRLSDNKKIVKVLDFVADIRRIAEGIDINQEAKRFAGEEIVPYPDGEIVKFSTDATNFFDQYLNDMSDISNLDDSARLEFPE